MNESTFRDTFESIIPKGQELVIGFFATIFFGLQPLVAQEIATPVNFEKRSQVNLLGGSHMQEVLLRITGESINKPLSWSVTVKDGSKTLFAATHDDTWLDGFFGDESYIDSCADYLSCKKKWYFTELPDLVFKGVFRTNKKTRSPEQWEISALRDLAGDYLEKQNLTPTQRGKAIEEMEHLLIQSYGQIILPKSPVEMDSSYMYVPTLGYFVPYWND